MGAYRKIDERSGRGYLPVAEKKFGSVGIVDLKTDAEKRLENLFFLACRVNLHKSIRCYIMEPSNDTNTTHKQSFIQLH